MAQVGRVRRPLHDDESLTARQAGAELLGLVHANRPILVAVEDYARPSDLPEPAGDVLPFHEAAERALDRVLGRRPPLGEPWLRVDALADDQSGDDILHAGRPVGRPLELEGLIAGEDPGILDPGLRVDERESLDAIGCGQ